MAQARIKHSIAEKQKRGRKNMSGALCTRITIKGDIKGEFPA